MNAKDKPQTTFKIGDVVHTCRPIIVNGKWGKEYSRATIAGLWQRYAILRRDKGRMPFLETIKNLEKNAKEMFK